MNTLASWLINQSLGNLVHTIQLFWSTLDMGHIEDCPMRPGFQDAQYLHRQKSEGQEQEKRDSRSKWHRGKIRGKETGRHNLWICFHFSWIRKSERNCYNVGESYVWLCKDCQPVLFSVLGEFSCMASSSREFCSLWILTNFWWCRFLKIWVMLSVWIAMSHCAFKLIFLMTNDVNRFFMCSLVIVYVPLKSICSSFWPILKLSV